MVLREVVKITGPEVLDMRETISRHEAEGRSLMHPTPWDQEFLLLLEINHIVFVLLYLINILLINEIENVRDYS